MRFAKDILGLIFFASLPIAWSQNRKCDLDEITVSITAVNDTVLEDGSIVDESTGDVYPNGTYYEIILGGNTLGVMGCPCSFSKPCVNKCCRGNMVMDAENGCVEIINADKVTFMISVTDDDGDNARLVGLDEHFRTFSSRPCHHVLRPDVEAKDQYYIRASDGMICLTDSNPSCLDARHFCVDYVTQLQSVQAFVCNPGDNREFERITFVVKEVATTFSLVVVVAVLIVFASIPELRTLQGKCQMCYLVSKVMFYALLLAHYRVNKGIVDVDNMKYICPTLASLNYYFYLAPFTWLNVMCFDICIPFIRNQRTSDKQKSTNFKKFLCYSLFAWFAPFLSLLYDLISIWVSSGLKLFKMELFYYYVIYFYNFCKTYEGFSLISRMDNYVPVSVSMIFNLILFVWTGFKLYRLNHRMSSKKQDRNAMLDDEIDEEPRQQVNMCFYLFLLKGFNWLLEPMYWILYKNFNWSNPLYVHRWNLIMRAIINFQGFFIFLIFIFSSKTLFWIGKRCCNSKRKSKDESSIGTEMSTYSAEFPEIRERPPSRKNEPHAESWHYSVRQDNFYT